MRFVAAATTKQERRKAAPIQQHQCLLAAFMIFGNRSFHFVGENLLLAVPCKDFAHVYDFDRSKWTTVDALGHFQVRVFSRVRVVKGFHRRRGAAQNDYGIGFQGADNGSVTSVVTRFGVLFIGGFVFFVHNDEADIFERRKNC